MVGSVLLLLILIILILFGIFVYINRDDYSVWIILSIIICPLAFIIGYFINKDYDEDIRKNKMVKFIRKFLIGYVVVMTVIAGIILLGLTFDDGDDENNKNYDQEWCQSYNNSVRKCYYSHYEDRCICEDR